LVIIGSFFKNVIIVCVAFDVVVDIVSVFSVVNIVNVVNVVNVINSVIFFKIGILGRRGFPVWGGII
jgi:hypothetical protein